MPRKPRKKPTIVQEQAVKAIARQAVEDAPPPKKQPAEPAAPDLRLKWTQYIPHHPTAKQLAYLLLPHKEAFYGGGAGGGKLLPCTEKIATNKGFVELGDLHPGDFVFGCDGQLHTILAESDVEYVEGYEFTFDDGSTVVSHDLHLWLTFNAKELKALTRRDPRWRAERQSRRPSRAKALRGETHSKSVILRNKTYPNPVTPPPAGVVRTTAEIVASLRTSTGRRNHAIPVTSPLNIPERGLKVDPYVLGVWLGDGSKSTSVITSMDPEITASVESAGYGVSSISKKSDNQASSFYHKGLVTDLRSIGVVPNKHIPDAYLWSSASQRLALLQGLMDTDGTVSKSSGSAEFCNTNPSIVRGVAHLVRSLGMKASIREGRAKLGGQDYGPKWTIKFMANQPVFRLERKRSLQKIASRRTSKFRYIVAAKRVKPQRMKCIKVSSPDHLYLASENLIPTHNSDALLMSALQYVDVPGFSGILFRRTLSELKLPGSLLDRAHSWLYNKPCKFIAGEHTYLFPTQYPNGTPGEPAKLVFGYLGLESAKARYQSAEFHFVGFDEVTHHAESDYLWMFSRIRKVTCSVHKTDPTGKPIYVPGCVECGVKSTAPERMRSASNPGNVGHQWVQARFKIEPVIDPVTNTARWVGKNPSAPFIPSLFKDNPYLDQISYRENLDQLDPLTRAQLQDGNWGASAEARFKANWFRRYSLRGDYYHLGRAGSGPAYFKTDFLRIFVTVDPAASASEGPGDLVNYNRLMQKSHTVIAVWGLTPEYNLLWLDNLRIYVESPDIIRALKGVYRQWKFSHAVIEATGLGKAVYQAAVRSGLPVRPVYPHTDKVMRATDAMIRAEQGRIWLPEHPGPGWLKPLEDELLTWTGHPQQSDDQIDALSHAANDVSWEAAHSDRANDPDLPQDEVIDANSPHVHGGSGFGGIGGFNRIHDPYEHV